MFSCKQNWTVFITCPSLIWYCIPTTKHLNIKYRLFLCLTFLCLYASVCVCDFFFSLIFVCYGGLKLLVKLLFSIFRNVWQFVFAQFVCTSLFIFDSRKTQTNKPEAFRKRKTTNIYAFHVNRTPLLPFLLNPILDFGNVYCTSSTVDVYFLPVAEHFIRIRRWIYF